MQPWFSFKFIILVNSFACVLCHRPIDTEITSTSALIEQIIITNINKTIFILLLISERTFLFIILKFKFSFFYFFYFFEYNAVNKFLAKLKISDD